ncbi:hypothetical protein Q1695_015295 [Nippostrongylus brasiliensis]|nr:hypothetical protein Q1695_015295 [Nippostrongylus brasiliensis]
MTLWEERKFARSLELLRLRGLVSELTEKLREQENTFEERVNNLLCRCREVNFAVEFAIKEYYRLVGEMNSMRFDLANDGIYLGNRPEYNPEWDDRESSDSES